MSSVCCMRTWSQSTPCSIAKADTHPPLYYFVEVNFKLAKSVMHSISKYRNAGKTLHSRIKTELVLAVESAGKSG